MGCTSSKSPNNGSPLGSTPNPNAVNEVERLHRLRMQKEITILHDKCSHMLEARVSCESIDDFYVQEQSIKATKAAMLIQKQARRKQALIEAKEDQKWLVFSQLDAYEESEMVNIAIFMEKAVSKIPTLMNTSANSTIISRLEERDADDGNNDTDNSNEKINLRRKLSSNQNIRLTKQDSSDVISLASYQSSRSINSANIMVSRENSGVHLLNIGKMTFMKEEESFNDYKLPAGKITARIAEDIIKVYKNGGKLNIQSVHKLLRLTFKLLRDMPNTTKITLGPTDRLTVVGDIHGQLQDLLYILDESAMPSANNKYIFNGDFVDRGHQGVEVMCILLALLLAMPNQVALNRGNHEDYAICCAYGFQAECEKKYDDVTFGMFCEVFHHLPLFAIVNSSVLILHGGLFHSDDISLKDLDEVNRAKFSLSYAYETSELSFIPKYKKDAYLQQICRDALWSDPMSNDGIAASPRGAGVAFGPDVTKKFLTNNCLKMIVRSHECVRSGFEQNFKDAGDAGILCTIFSASNYCGGGNSAAYMVFYSNIAREKQRVIDLNINVNGNKHLSTPMRSSTSCNNLSSLSSGSSCSSSNKHIYHVPDSDLHYSVYYYSVLAEESNYLLALDGGDEFDDNDSSSEAGLSLYDLILRKKGLLADEFRNRDVTKEGIISKAVWAEVMEKTIRLHIRWLMLVDEVCSHDCIIDSKYIEYNKFLKGYTISVRKHDSSTPSLTDDATSDTDNSQASVDQTATATATATAADGNLIDDNLAEALYGQHHKLEAVFRFFDHDGDGIIMKEDFLSGCHLLNETLDSHEKFDTVNFEEILHILDIDGSGMININAFFEMFRLSSSSSRRLRKSSIHCSTKFQNAFYKDNDRRDSISVDTPVESGNISLTFSHDDAVDV